MVVGSLIIIRSGFISFWVLCGISIERGTLHSVEARLYKFQSLPGRLRCRTRCWDCGVCRSRQSWESVDLWAWCSLPWHSRQSLSCWVNYRNSRDGYRRRNQSICQSRLVMRNHLWYSSENRKPWNLWNLSACLWNDSDGLHHWE